MELTADFNAAFSKSTKKQEKHSPTVLSVFILVLLCAEKLSFRKVKNICARVRHTWLLGNWRSNAF